jgi:hypothetical protein
MVIYNNNTIMPSIYTNTEVRYTYYLPVGSYFDPLCVNYFGRVEQENFSLNSSATFSQPTTMQQVMSMNDLYGRINLDGSANYFGHSYATQVTRTEVTPNHYSQMNEYANANVPSDNTQAYSTPSQKFCTSPRSLLESYSY